MSRSALGLVLLVLTAFGIPVLADDAPALRYKALEIEKAGFTKSSMAAQERDDYASNLSRVAIENAHGDSSDESLLRSRKLLALALQLSPRNRSAVVANHQLGRGLLPEKKEADYSDAVFARLLLTRAKLLTETGDEVDKRLAKCFVEIAAELDPRNEDAVYQFELQKMDSGTVDWDALMDGDA